MINVIDTALAVTDIHQQLQDGGDIVLAQYAFAFRIRPANAPIKFHPSNVGQIVSFRVKEQIIEEILGRILGRGLTRSHHPVYLNQRFQLRGG